MKRGLLLLALFFIAAYSHATIITIGSINSTFVPNSVTITVGDSIIFQLDTFNNAQEVSLDTWNANDSLPVTGFQIPKGGGLLTGLSIGTHYYVSSPNADIGMKGQIIVMPAASIRFTKTSDTLPESAGVVTIIAEVNNPGPYTTTYTISADTITSSARRSADYTYNNTTFSHPIGTFLDTVYISIVDEQLIEPTETVVLRFTNISSNTVATADSVYTLFILNDDTLSVSFLGAAFSYIETDTIIHIPVVISSPVPNATSITVALDSGNAIRGINFNCDTLTTLTFAANTSDTLYIPVQLIDDTLGTVNLQANFSLHNPTNGARLGISAYTLFIIDNDVNTGIFGTAQNRMALYPNPANKMLHIATEQTYTEVIISDMLGNGVLESTLPVGNNTLDISSLPQGSYVIIARSPQSMAVGRFMKVE